MGKYNCIIVDDEQDAIDLLESRLAVLFNDITVVGKYLNWQEALSAIRKTNFDLVFFDISMPGKSGLEVLKLVPGLTSEIIFVTAHDNYAVDAFAFAAVGYILKPIDDTDLSLAINKALDRINMKMLAKQAIPAPTKKLNDKIGVPNNHGVDYIKVQDILYLETFNKCTQIVTSTGKFISSTNIGSFRYLIEQNNFFQVHRSYIINPACILRYDSSGLVVMVNKKEIPVSRYLKQDFLKMFNSVGRAF